MKIVRRKTGLDQKQKGTANAKRAKNLFDRLSGIFSNNDKVDAVDETNFVTKLAEIDDINTKEEFDQLIVDIEKAASLLVNHPVMGNVNHYKTLVQKFLKKIVTEAYVVKEKIFRKSPTEEKVYIKIDKINSELEELTEQILTKQKDSIKLAAKLEEIKGLLIDLYK